MKHNTKHFVLPLVIGGVLTYGGIKCISFNNSTYDTLIGSRMTVRTLDAQIETSRKTLDSLINAREMIYTTMDPTEKNMPEESINNLQKKRFGENLPPLIAMGIGIGSAFYGIIRKTLYDT